MFCIQFGNMYLLAFKKALLRFELRISCLLDRRFNQLSHGARCPVGLLKIVFPKTSTSLLIDLNLMVLIYVYQGMYTDHIDFLINYGKSMLCCISLCNETSFPTLIMSVLACKVSVKRPRWDSNPGSPVY